MDQDAGIDESPKKRKKRNLKFLLEIREQKDMVGQIGVSNWWFRLVVGVKLF